MKRIFLIFSILVLIVLLLTGINQKINSARSRSINTESKAIIENQILKVDYVI